MKYTLFGILLLVLIGCTSPTFTNVDGDKIEADQLDLDAPLEARLEQMETLSYKATYVMAMESGFDDAEDQGVNMQASITQYYDAQGYIRQDASIGGQQMVTLLKDGKGYTCLSAGGEWRCAEIPLGDAQIQDFGTQIRTYAGQYDAPPLDPRVIAGVQAACYGLDVDLASVEYCFSPEGVPLYSNTDSRFITMKLEATEYTLGVSKDDFELPAAPQGTIEDLFMSQSGAGSLK